MQIMKPPPYSDATHNCAIKFTAYARAARKVSSTSVLMFVTLRLCLLRAYMARHVATWHEMARLIL
jgi:hypothetical protein